MFSVCLLIVNFLLQDRRKHTQLAQVKPTQNTKLSNGFCHFLLILKPLEDKLPLHVTRVPVGAPPLKNAWRATGVLSGTADGIPQPSPSYATQATPQSSNTTEAGNVEAV